MVLSDFYLFLSIDVQCFPIYYMALIDFQKTQIFVKNKKDRPNAVFTLFP